MAQKLTDLITDFLEYCEIEKGLSPTTAQKYDYRLSRLVKWLGDSDLTADAIRKFRVYLNRQDLASSTQYHYAVTIRAFLKYLAKSDIKAPDPEKVELGKYDRTAGLKFLNPKQLEDLLNQPDTSTKIGLRDRAILELFFSTGLRVSELVGLNVDDIDLERQEFSVVGKGSTRRVVFLSSSAKQWLSRYLERRQDAWKPLFISYSGPKRQKGSRSHEKRLLTSEVTRSGSSEVSSGDEVVEDPHGERHRLTTRSVQRMIKKYAKRAGLGVNATPHTLRHSFATDLLRAGADIRTVQESLGHRNISTTQIYTHVTDFDLKEAHRRFHGKWRSTS